MDWIKASEGLPDEGEEVFVCLIDTDGGFVYFTGHYWDEDTDICWFDGDYLYEKKDYKRAYWAHFSPPEG